MAKKGPNIQEFNRRFPDEDTCLNHLMRVRFGERLTCFKCQKQATYYRVSTRQCFVCEHCGHQVYPMAGTPFKSTRTPLRDWFYVMFLFCASRNGVAAKEVERQLGVTYKTAWRMCNLIRKYMGEVDGDEYLGGDGDSNTVVEVDKAFIGGKDVKGYDDKAVVLGMIERQGDVITRVVPDRSEESVIPHIIENVTPGTKIASDEAQAFRNLGQHYRHATVNHRAKEYVRGDVHTNTMEAFWANVKRGIKGTYVHVSKKHLQTYLREFEYRHNLRRTPYLMFDLLLAAFPKARVG